MKKSVLKLLSIFTCLSVLGIAGCNKEEEKSNGSLSTFEYASYEDIKTLSDDEVTTYLRSVNDNEPVDNGIIMSPYHSLKINSIDVPLYATRTTNGIHSFAYLNVIEDKVNLSVEITSSVKKFTSIEILPLSSNVVGTTLNGVTTATITNFGSFTFAFNKKSDYPVTLMVTKKQEFSLPEGYKKIEISPKEKVNGEYPLFAASETTFKDTNTAYYFKKGHYMIREITLPSNSVFYFEPGVYIEDYLIGNSEEERKTDYTTLIHATNVENVHIYGNALVDYSCHYGGPAGHKCKGQFSVSSTKNIKSEGFIFINASSWQYCFTNSTNVEVCNSLLYGYRTCSDGIMLSDCQDSYVHHNFVRTGDDAIEAKSTGSQGGKNIIYEYNDVWADKARCYGIIYESNKDASNIIFRHNSVGFSQAAWTDDVGCLAVIMGTNKNTTWSDIHFEDIEIYSCKSHALCMSICDSTGGIAAQSNYGGQAKNIFYKDVTVHCKFLNHEELVYINVGEDCSLKKVTIENFRYMNIANQMTTFTKEDLSDPMMTECKTSNGAKASNIAEVL